jgi:hypothetical protein
VLLGEAKGVNQISNKSNPNEGQEDSSSVQNLVREASLNMDEGTIRNLKNSKIRNWIAQVNSKYY